jgi:hypothetical protein
LTREWQRITIIPHSNGEKAMHEVGRWIGLIICGILAISLLNRIGWKFSRMVLYPGPWAICIALLAGWGIAIAWGFRHLVLWTHPGWILGFILFGMAAYVSVPNFGLFDESTIPDHVQLRHITISNLALLVFLVCSLLFMFIIKN